METSDSFAWITPGGTIYHVVRSHAETASKLLEVPLDDGVDVAFEKKWARITHMGKTLCANLRGGHKLTRTQRSTLIDIAIEGGFRKLIFDDGDSHHEMLWSLENALNENALNENALNENALNVVLDILGFIPGIGEAADFANVTIFLKRAQTSADPGTDYLFAALSLVAMVPAVGDVVGKGGKALVGAAKAGKLAKSSPLLLKIQKAIVKAGPEIEKILTALSGKSNTFKPYARKMKEVLTKFAKEPVTSAEPVVPVPTTPATTPTTPATTPVQESRLRISRLLEGEVIKLRGFGAPASPAKLLISEVEDMGEPHPSKEGTMIGDVLLELSSRGDTVVSIHVIQTVEGSTDQGRASGVLKQLIILADDLGVTLTLYAKDFTGRSRLSVSQLVSWYEKNGFEALGAIDSHGGVDMVRKPQGKLKLGNSWTAGVAFYSA